MRRRINFLPLAFQDSDKLCEAFGADLLAESNGFLVTKALNLFARLAKHWKDIATLDGAQNGELALEHLVAVGMAWTLEMAETDNFQLAAEMQDSRLGARIVNDEELLERLAGVRVIRELDDFVAPLFILPLLGRHQLRKLFCHIY